MFSQSASLPLNTVATTLLFTLFITLPLPSEGGYVPSFPFSLSSRPGLCLQLVEIKEVICCCLWKELVASCDADTLIILILLIHERESRLHDPTGKLTDIFVWRIPESTFLYFELHNEELQ